MRRRAFLATVGTVALAGCTASGESDSPEYTVTGVTDSDVYTDADVLDSISIYDWLSNTAVVLELTFDPDGEYDPLEHEVALFDGHTEIATGKRGGSLLEPADDRIEFNLTHEALDDGGPWDVVSVSPRGVVDEFELEVSRE